jgi:hypothetical protein
MRRVITAEVFGKSGNRFESLHVPEGHGLTGTNRNGGIIERTQNRRDRLRAADYPEPADGAKARRRLWALELREDLRDRYSCYTSQFSIERPGTCAK